MPLRARSPGTSGSAAGTAHHAQANQLVLVETQHADLHLGRVRPGRLIAESPGGQLRRSGSRASLSRRAIEADRVASRRDLDEAGRHRLHFPQQPAPPRRAAQSIRPVTAAPGLGQCERFRHRPHQSNGSPSIRSSVAEPETTSAGADRMRREVGRRATSRVTPPGRPEAVRARPALRRRERRPRAARACSVAVPQQQTGEQAATTLLRQALEPDPTCGRGRGRQRSVSPAHDREACRGSPRSGAGGRTR